MSHLDILLPFGVPQAELAADLVRELETSPGTPALSTLLGRARAGAVQPIDPFARSLPHETWLARRFGLEAGMAESGSPPIASSWMRYRGLPASGGAWFVLHPVHIHVARDHLVLTDRRHLSLGTQESQALYESAEPLFREAGHPLVFGDAAAWFVRADGWSGLATSTPDSACGHNIDIWMPTGPAERDWRRLQNEVQMTWHDHPVNAARESRGMKPVNSLWLWGGSVHGGNQPAAHPAQAFNLPAWAAGLAPSVSSATQASEVLAAATGPALVVLDSLVEPALAGDWSEWLRRMRELEDKWFAPLLAALKTGQVNQLALTLTGAAGWREFRAAPTSLRKFWAKPSLARLKP